MREAYKTTIRKSTPNPVFNEVSVFKACAKELNDLFIKVDAFESLRDMKEIKLGEVVVGPNEENNKEKKPFSIPNHWQQMIRSLRRPVIQFKFFK